MFYNTYDVNDDTFVPEQPVRLRVEENAVLMVSLPHSESAEPLQSTVLRDDGSRVPEAVSGTVGAS